MKSKANMLAAFAADFVAQDVRLAPDLKPELEAYAKGVITDDSLPLTGAVDRLIGYAQAINSIAGRAVVLGEPHPRALVLSGYFAAPWMIPQPVQIVLEPLTIFEDGSAFGSTGVHASFLTAWECVDSRVVTLVYCGAKPGDPITSVREWLEERGVVVAAEHFLIEEDPDAPIRSREGREADRRTAR